MRFHESMHGKDFQDFISQHPLPHVNVVLPVTKMEYDAAAATWQTDFDTNVTEMSNYPENRTDEVGVKKSSLP